MPVCPLCPVGPGTTGTWTESPLHCVQVGDGDSPDFRPHRPTSEAASDCFFISGTQKACWVTLVSPCELPGPARAVLSAERSRNHSQEMRIGAPGVF